MRCDLLLGGDDLLAIDVVAAQAMGFGVEEIPLLALASELGRVRPSEVDLVGDFAGLASLPKKPFRLTIGKIRRVALWLNGFDVDLEPLHAAMDPVRATWHRVNRWKKKERLAEGPWKAYAEE